MRSSLLVTVAAAGLLTAATAASAAGTWVAAVPVSGSAEMLLFGINDHNIVTGMYSESGSYHGMVGPFDGTNYQSFDDSGGDTEGRAINDRGWITGTNFGSQIPWERSPSGTLTNVTRNGTTLGGTAQGLNKKGVFAGNYYNAFSEATGYRGRQWVFRHGFKLNLNNAGYAGRGIDSAGDIVGWYYDISGIQHGFLSVGGTVTSIDYPGALTTVVEGINDKGYLSGQWVDSKNVTHGFLYQISTQKFTNLNAPGATATQVWGINDHGVVAASATVGNTTKSFAYCMTSKGCPTTGAARSPQPTEKASPAAIRP